MCNMNKRMGYIYIYIYTRMRDQGLYQRNHPRYDSIPESSQPEAGDNSGKVRLLTAKSAPIIPQSSHLKNHLTTDFPSS